MYQVHSTIDTATGKEAPAALSEERVKTIFTEIADQYEKFNHYSSFGQDRRWLDKLLGFVFSILTMALVVGILANLFDSINVKFHLVSEELLASSVLYPPIKTLGLAVFPFLRQLFMKS